MSYTINYVKVLNPEKLTNKDRFNGYVYINGLHLTPKDIKNNTTLSLNTWEQPFSPKRLSEVRKECTRRGIQIEVNVTFSGLKIKLKRFQTDEALKARAERKMDKKKCDERAKLGKYKAEYSKMMNFHCKAVGFGPVIPELLHRHFTGV